MPLVMKLDDKGQPTITEDKKIIYVDDDGKDLPLDPAGMYDKITSLGTQNKKDRTKYTELRDTYAGFKDIEDISEWKEKADAALVSVENFNDKDWMKVDKVDKLKSDMKDSYELKLTGKDTVLAETLQTHATDIAGKDGQIRVLMVSNKFAGSPHFIGDTKITTLPPDIGEAQFGKHFKVEEDDKGESVLRSYFSNGDPILSKVNPGEPADFEESMGFIIDQYPGKDSILSSTAGGSGGPGGQGDPNPANALEKLKTQHEEARKVGNTQLMISLKNKIFDLQQKTQQ